MNKRATNSETGLLEKTKVARKRVLRSSKPSTGLPGGQSNFERDVNKIECMHCGHCYEGAEITVLDDETQTHWKPDPSNPRNGESYLTCIHCRSQKGFKDWHTGDEYTVLSGKKGFVREPGEIAKKEQEYFERVRFMHPIVLGDLSQERKACKQAYSKIFGPFPKDFYEWSAGYWHGQLDALRWALGAQEDFMAKGGSPQETGHRLACLCCRSQGGLQCNSRWKNQTYKAFAGRPRNYAEIVSKEDEFFERVWYERHMRSGRPEVGRKAADRVREMYGDLPNGF